MTSDIVATRNRRNEKDNSKNKNEETGDSYQGVRRGGRTQAADTRKPQPPKPKQAESDEGSDMEVDTVDDGKNEQDVSDKENSENKNPKDKNKNNKSKNDKDKKPQKPKISRQTFDEEVARRPPRLTKGRTVQFKLKKKMIHGEQVGWLM